MNALGRRLLRLSITLGMIGTLLYFVPLRSIGEAFSGADPRYFVLGVSIMLLARAVATPRMRVIAGNQGFEVSHAELFRILLISQYYAHVLPGPLVGGGATWLKYVQAGASRSAAAATVLLNRGISLVMMVALGAAAWLATESRLDTPWAVLFSALIIAAAMCLMFVRPPLPAEGRSHAPAGRLVAALWSFARQLSRFEKARTAGKLIVVGSSIAFEIVTASALWCFALAVGLDIGLLTVVWMRAALQIVLLLPIHFGGLGLREVTLVGLGSAIGISPAAALAWSLLIFAGNVLLAVAGGLLEVSWLERRVSPDHRSRFRWP